MKLNHIEVNASMEVTFNFSLWGIIKWRLAGKLRQKDVEQIIEVTAKQAYKVASDNIQDAIKQARHGTIQ